MRLIFAGTPSVAVPSLEYLAAHHDVVAVLTRAPAPYGRKRTILPSPVHQQAEKLGIPVLTPADLHDPRVCHELDSYQADAAAVVAYGKILPQAILHTTTHGWYNLHFSSLPRWRGAAPVQYAIAAGDKTIGTCVFRVEKGLDTGPIVASARYELSPTATSGEVLEHLAHVGALQLCQALYDVVHGAAQFTEQEGEATYAPSLTSQDSRIDWNAPAQRIVNTIRAYTPEPGAWALFNGQRVKIAPVHTVSSPEHPDTEQPDTPVQQKHTGHAMLSELQPGEIRMESGHAYVGTADQPVVLSQVTPAGKRCMNGADWVRGLHAPYLAFDS